MGAGFDYVVKTACVYNNELYIGGEFTGTGFTPLFYLVDKTENITDNHSKTVP